MTERNLQWVLVVSLSVAIVAWHKLLFLQVCWLFLRVLFRWFTRGGV